MKKVFAFLMIFLIAICGFPAYAASLPQNMTEASGFILETVTEIQNLKFQLDNTKNPFVIEFLASCIEQKNEELKVYKNIYISHKEKYDEYPAAYEIWYYMKDLGWSDAVCAGILGNIMTEVGGRTLNIQYWLYDKPQQFYGMCQWSKKYYPEVQGVGLQEQLDFLASTIEYEIDTFGYMYQDSMNFETFLTLNTPEEVALCFAKAYERCASFSYELREESSQIAYEYFGQKN